MTRTILGGAALAALLAATPTLAQDVEMCVLADMPDGSVRAEARKTIDLDGDGTITLAEYEECLATNEIPDDRRAAMLAEFERLDIDDDDRLVVAELDGAAGTEAADAAEPAEVTVAEAPAAVKVDQPAPEVRVTQGDPKVAVEQPEPQVAVNQPKPKVEVTQKKPEVSVRQPEPTVEVEQGEPTVSVDQPAPQVAIDAPPPKVEVTQAEPKVTVEQVKPKVSVEQPDPVVTVEKADADVEVETEEPRVVVKQGEPQVVIERVSDAAPQASDEAAATSSADADEPIAMAANTATDDGAAGVPVEASSVAMGVPFDELEGEVAYNDAGEKVGKITDIVMKQSSGELFLVVSAGGFLGIGDTDVVFPYESASISDDHVMIDTDLTAETVEDRTDYDESAYVEVPEDRVVR
ncbi:PRC-barrel domain-containing protein [Acuticoccus mangrovi]|uniref:PRC-barrel domain-containing protein n=1 Tax=Acuticoccus mangrovi TaxID=2796142 RepID=A0A934MHC9_9HYPH|nr:PRC-barrel domain-containing protein [Acuticoccus mangrovi]MBJ3776815.1 PRC-barrel domain-containing protein [Acuticoccus mangrovi]